MTTKHTPDDMILTDADLNLCLGSGELKRCPFCGDRPMSSGERIEGRIGKAIRWKIQCMGSSGLVPNCFASVLAVDPDQDKARTTAVERWNKRTLLGIADPANALRLAREALKSCQLVPTDSDPEAEHRPVFDESLVSKALAALTPEQEA